MKDNKAKIISEESIKVQVPKDIISTGKHEAKLVEMYLFRNLDEIYLRNIYEITENEHRGQRIIIHNQFCSAEEIQKYINDRWPNLKILDSLRFLLSRIGEKEIIYIDQIAYLRNEAIEVSGCHAYYIGEPKYDQS